MHLSTYLVQLDYVRMVQPALNEDLSLIVGLEAVTWKPLHCPVLACGDSVKTGVIHLMTGRASHLQ